MISANKPSTKLFRRAPCYLAMSSDRHHANVKRHGAVCPCHLSAAHHSQPNNCRRCEMNAQVRITKSESSPAQDKPVSTLNPVHSATKVGGRRGTEKTSQIATRSNAETPKKTAVSAKSGRKPVLAKLTFKPRKAYIHHRLPHVGTSNYKPECGISFWDVPLTGGYAGGCDTGAALAVILLKHLRDLDKGDDMARFHFGSIANDWLDRAKNITPDQDDALRGQIVGFMAAITPWVIAATKQLGHKLDGVDSKEALKKANAGLSCPDLTL